jgi:hypothetical protein
MSGGKRIKFQDTRIQFLTGWSADSPSSVISAISKADPAVVSESAHGKSTGDVVRILGALGMTEVNDVPALISKIDAGNYSLIGVDSSDYGAYQASSGKADLAEFSTLCELTGFNRQGGSSPEIAATSQCSTAQEFEIGLPDFGTVQVDFNYSPDVAVQQAIDLAYNSGSTFAYKILFNKKPGVFVIGFGFVQQTSEQGQVGGLWTGSFTMRSTGKKYLFANGALVA